MTSKNGADFVHYVMQAQAPASHNGQSRAKLFDFFITFEGQLNALSQGLRLN